MKNCNALISHYTLILQFIFPYDLQEFTFNSESILAITVSVKNRFT